jgi:hypothetical protein
MEYPNTKFSRKVRLAMLIVFIIAFFVISPIIIMYTAGFRYDWQNGLLKETGAISVDVEPKTATVYLNGIRLQDKMPIRLNNIAPAKYNLRISAPEYFDWQKEIEVKNKQTNYTKEISLIKKGKPEILINGQVDNINISFDGRFIIYSTQKNNTTEIWLWDNTANQGTILSRLNNKKPLKIIWAEKNNYALITDESAPYSRLLIINPENPSKQTDLVKNNSVIKKFQWGNSVEPQLYYSTRDNIFLYSPVTAKAQVVTKNTYIDWYMEDGQLWTMKTDSTTKQYNITRDTLGFNSAFNHLDSTDINLATGKIVSSNLQILAARQNTILLKNAKDSEMILLTNSNRYKISADKFLISKYNNWWLLWSQWELWTYSEGEEPYLLNRSGEYLQEVTPMDKYNTLAITWANKTTVLFPYYLATHDLLNEKITDIAADTDNKIIYFVNKTKNKEGIWKLSY